MSEVEYKVRLDNIQVGDRCRRDLGDLDELAASIKEVGLLQPVVITPDKTLIAGQRRLEAVRKLGWVEVPVHVVTGVEEVYQALRAEGEENVCRKGFNPSEAAALGRRIEGLERAAAKERQALAGPVEGPGKKGVGSGKLPEAVKGDTRDKVAAVVGMSGRTYEKVKAVVEAAEREPDKYGHLVEKMDQSGKADGAYRELKKGRETARPARKRRRKEDIKTMLDNLMKKAKPFGETVPPTVQVLHGGKRQTYALKLSELSRVLDLWAKAITPASVEAK